MPPALPAAAVVVPEAAVAVPAPAVKVNPFERSQGIHVLFILSQTHMIGQEYLERALHMRSVAFASELYLLRMGGRKT